MGTYALAGLVLRRIFGALPVLLIVSLITFVMMRLIPGDPSAVIGGLRATPAPLEQICKNLGLGEPFTLQLVRGYGGGLAGQIRRGILLGPGAMCGTLSPGAVTGWL